MADVAVENAPNDENDDNWLYGESNNEQTEENEQENCEKVQLTPNAEKKNMETEDKDEEEGGEGNNEDSHFNDEHFGEVTRDDKEDANGDADSQENGDSDSDDSDDVKVTIGEIKSGPQAYASLNIKRGVGIVGAAGAEKPRQGQTAGNKVTLEDLEGPGSINGVPALEFNIDTIEDKPWNKPGADISDYFNYGFNEVTWSAYCERQRRMRVHETGVGMHAPPPRAPPPDMRRPPGPMRHEEMPPGNQGNYQNRENTIQVMTAERREYGRGLRDAPEYFAAPPHEHYYPPPVMPPTYEEPWGHGGGMPGHGAHADGGWAPGDIKELTPGPMGPPAGAPPPLMPPAPLMHYRPPERHERERHERERHERERHERHERHRRDEDERDRDRERDRSRSIKPDRIREKSYRRERSRSRSRRHKSRSRSPRMRERSRERERSRDRDRDRDRERERKPKTKEAKDKEDEK